jgi:hypothetical protein
MRRQGLFNLMTVAPIKANSKFFHLVNTGWFRIIANDDQSPQTSGI